MRDLAAGEHIDLACGLSLVIPAAYDGYYVSGPTSAINTYLDLVASSRSSREGLLFSFQAGSVEKAGERLSPGPFRWPLVARSKDGTVEVRSVAAHLGTARAIALTAVVVRLSGRPAGLVLIDTFGTEASDKPGTVLKQARSLWRRFAVSGASVPAL